MLGIAGIACFVIIVVLLVRVWSLWTVVADVIHTVGVPVDRVVGISEVTQVTHVADSIIVHIILVLVEYVGTVVLQKRNI